MNYVLVSGYHRPPADPNSAGFFNIWLKNSCSVLPVPRCIIVIADSKNHPNVNFDEVLKSIPFVGIGLEGDLGSCHAELTGAKKYQFAGWTGVVLAGALLAYSNESDMIFKEEDCLWFGNCVQKMYEEIGAGGIIFGSNHFMACAQSLFLVRHWYIPEFVRLFLGEGPQTDEANISENIFKRLEEKHPDKWKRFSFGYDRDRPFNPDDPAWYIQQVKTDELVLLKEKGLI